MRPLPPSWCCLAMGLWAGEEVEREGWVDSRYGVKLEWTEPAEALDVGMRDSKGGLPTFPWVLQGGAPRGEGASDPVPAGTSSAPPKLHRQLLIHLEETCSRTALGKGLRRCEISLFLSLGETNLLLEIELEGWQIVPVHQLNIHCP